MAEVIFDRDSEEPPKPKVVFDKAPTQPPKPKVVFDDPVELPRFNEAELAQYDEVYTPIRDYMNYYHNMDEVAHSREEIVDSFITNMRKFKVGHSISNLNTVGRVMAADDKGKVIAHDAWKIFDEKYAGAFDESASWRDTGEAVGDYLWGVVSDPLNYVGIGAGTVVKAGAKKAGAEALQLAVQSAVTNQAKKKITQDAAKSYLRKGGLTTIAVDTATQTGIELVHQTGLLKAGRQVDYDLFNLSLVAATGVAGGYAGYRFFDANSKMVNKQMMDLAVGGRSFKDVATDVAVEGVKDWGSLADGVVKMLEVYKNDSLKATKPFRERLEAGGELMRQSKYTQTDKEFDFWSYMILGNPEEGVKGLAREAYEAGVRFDGPRYEGDNISSMISDVIQRMPEDQKGRFVTAFREAAEAGDMTDMINFTMEDIADLFSKKASLAGKQLNISSQVARMWGAMKEVNPGMKDKPETFGDELKAARALWDAVGDEVEAGPNYFGFFQSNYVRAVVSHPATTMLNIKGTGARMLHEGMSNILYGTLYYGGKGVTGWNVKDFQKAAHMWKVEAKRFRNLLAPETNFEEFESYMTVRPEAGKTLARWMSGGIDDADMAKAFNIDLNQSATARYTDKYVDVMQKVSGARLQDIVFKTQNFMYFMDRNIREAYGMSYGDFIKQPDFMKTMVTKDFKKLEANAIDETLKSTFSKPFGQNAKEGAVYEVAKWIEDFRKVPVIGALAPFGSFFNNTVSYVFEYGGPDFLWQAYKFTGGPQPRHGDPASYSRLVRSGMRAAATFTAVAMFASEDEQNYRDGLSWNQHRTEDGRVIEKRYDYPESLFRWWARALNHKKFDGDVPRDLMLDGSKTFLLASWARGLSDVQTDAGDILMRPFVDDNDLESTLMLGLELISLGGSQIVSGYTRPIDPVNQMAGFLQGEDYALPDRKQGIKIINDTFRYLDQIPKLLGADIGPEEKNYPGKGQLPSQPGAVMGFREVGAMPIERLFSQIGRETWKTGIQDGANLPGANNRINTLLFEELNKRAAPYLTNNNFLDLDLPARTKIVNKVVTDSVNAAKSRLLWNLEDTKDLRVWRLFKLMSDTNNLELMYAKRNLGIQTKDDDLTLEEIQQINVFLTNKPYHDIIDLYSSE